MEERRSGSYRRTEDQVVYESGEPTRGRDPLVYKLIIFQTIIGLVAIAALIFSITTFSDRIDQIQQSRVQAATDSCYLVREFVLEASAAGHNIKAGQAFLNNPKNPLSNCIHYGRDVTQLPHK